MFFFYHSEQVTSNQSFYKGKLFESLLKEYLNSLGYEVTLREKHNGLEYDIEGVDRATRRKLLGEAKAHSATVAGKDLSAFVGKLLPLGLADRGINGLFLSTSSLSPDAEDYLRSVSNFGILAHSGDGLQEDIRRSLKLPEFEPLALQVGEKGYSGQAHHILKTNHGTYIVITAGSQTSAAPACFAVFGGNAQPLSDSSFLKRIADSVPELNSLIPIVFESIQIVQPERTINQGLIVGENWTDYRFPAAPEYFVGRQEFIDKILTHIKSGKGSTSIPNVIQIKSRSGVGKSSTLAFLENEFEKLGFVTELHDARDVRSLLDIFSIVQRFTKAESAPGDFKGVEKQLKEFSFGLANMRAVFMVDQFESTFSKPELFQAYETLATLFLKHGPTLWVCFARKNDQITTYDESKVSLNKLNQIAKHFELKDFQLNEAAELLQKANAASIRPVNDTILSYVLEFAQGFPWLVKRTLAHIMNLSERQTIRNDVLESVLGLEDLFDEELEGLDEIDREYLTRIAARLPADLNALQSQFDDDPNLPKVLVKLTESKLLRLTGLTYDTYNDVFKEYLVYGKLPEFKLALIYRLTPTPTLAALNWAAEISGFTVRDLMDQFGLRRGSAFNRIRELTALNLIKREHGSWFVTRTIKDILNKGRLGEYIRSQILSNTIVPDLINKISQAREINTSSIPKYLEEHFPFVQATETTWRTYAASLVSWLVATRLVYDQQGTLSIPSETRKNILEGLGNLTNIPSRSGSQRRHLSSTKTVFLPNASWPKLERTVQRLIKGEAVEQKDMVKVGIDLRQCGWVFDGVLTIKSLAQLKEECKKLMDTAAYDDFWKSAATGTAVTLAFNRSFPNDYSVETLKWRIKTLVSWGRGAGILFRRASKYGLTFDNPDQPKLFVSNE